MLYNLTKRLTNELSFLRKRNDRLLSDYLYLLLLQASNYLIPFLGFRYIVKVIGIEKFGYLQFANSLVAYFILIVNYSFDYTATRKIAIHKDDKQVLQEIFWQVSYTKFILLLVSFLLFLPVCLAYPLFRENIVLFLSTFLITIGYSFFPTWFYQGMGQMRLAALFNFFIKAVSILVIVLLVKKRDEYMYFNLIFSLSQIFIGFVAFFYPIRKYHLSVQPFDCAKTIAWLKEGANLFLSVIISSLYTTTNVFLMGLLLTDKTEVGYFSMGSRLLMALQFLLVTPFSQLSFPLIARKFHESAQAGDRALKRTLFVYSIVTMLTSLLIFIFAPFFIRIVYGQAFPEASVQFRMMAFLPFIISFSNIFGVQGLINIHGDKYFRRVILTGAILSLTLNFLLIPSLRGRGAIFTWYLVEILISFCMFFFYSKKIKAFHGV